jgi:FKBP-type peptidyl-prolyl cis-trans isomerase 2
MSKPGNVIPGWADALMQLNNGAKATLYIPSSLAYGKKGALPLIKPNENIVFEIEVVKMITEIQAMEIVSENMQRAEEAEQKKQNQN